MISNIMLNIFHHLNVFTMVLFTAHRLTSNQFLQFAILIESRASVLLSATRGHCFLRLL